MTAGSLLVLGASWYAAGVLRLAVAYKAKILCSGVFVAHRDPGDVLADDLARGTHAVFPLIPSRIDRAQQTVAAGWTMTWQGVALHRPGLGCTLVYPALRNGGVPAYREGLAVAGTPSHPKSLEADPLSAAPQVAAEPLRPLLVGAFGAEFGTRAVVIVHRGRIVAERYANGFGPATPLAGWSMAKSATNALLGILVRDGRLTLSEPAPVSEWSGQHDARRDITIEQLLRMTSGLRFSESYRDLLEDVMQMLLAEPDAAAYAVSKPLDHRPGTHWQYSGGTTNILARLIRSRVGDPAYPYFPRQALFDRLGMQTAVLEMDAAGNFIGSSFMYASARDWARLGMLYLNDGVWGAARILPEGWVEFSRQPTTTSPEGEFGAHFWLRIPSDYRDPDRRVLLPPDAFHAIGYEGQFISIVPSHQLVVVRLGLTRRAGTWLHDRFLAAVIAAVDSAHDG